MAWGTPSRIRPSSTPHKPAPHWDRCTHALIPRPSSELNRTCRIRKLDNVCVEEGIGRIDLLKIDAEGHELAVLRGASENSRKAITRSNSV